ncbi:YidB family protein [Brucella abortus]|nr:YidB family protein [Brucella abortus]
MALAGFGSAAAGNASAAPAPGPLGGGLGGLLLPVEAVRPWRQGGFWAGQGENHPIEPGQLGNAIGQTTLEQIAAHASIDQQELLEPAFPGSAGAGGQADGQRPGAGRQHAFQRFSRAVDRNGHVTHRTAPPAGAVLFFGWFAKLEGIPI